MASITVRNLDETVKQRLRVRAARHGWSMEQEIRRILEESVSEHPAKGNFAERVHSRFADLGADQLPIPTRKPARLPPGFDKE
jgi:plasmid stability protein